MSYSGIVIEAAIRICDIVRQSEDTIFVKRPMERRLMFQNSMAPAAASLNYSMLAFCSHGHEIATLT